MRDVMQIQPVPAPDSWIREGNHEGQWPEKAEEIADRHLREREERARKERARFDLD